MITKLLGLTTLALLAPLALPAAAVAQSNVGIYVSKGPVTTTGILCGFNCGSPTNTGTATAAVYDILDVRVLGTNGQPGYVFLAAGPVFPCPGIPIAGITNALLLNPAYVVPIAFGLPALLGAARGTCGETGLGVVLSQVQIPLGASGGKISMQGLTVSGGTYHFTRPIELTVL